MVAVAYAVADPEAVMVVSKYTGLTFRTMFGPVWPNGRHNIDSIGS